MVVVAQLVRAPDCDSGGRGFEPHHPPKKAPFHKGLFFLNKSTTQQTNQTTTQPINYSTNYLFNKRLFSIKDIVKLKKDLFPLFLHYAQNCKFYDE